MNSSRTICVLGLVLAFLWTSGCSTPQTRIQSDPETFAGFSPDVQEKIRAGEIEIGFTEEMVLMALGKPNRRYRTQTEDGEAVAWAYHTRGSRVSFGIGGGVARGRGSGVYSGGVGVGTGAPLRAEERMRVVFVDGEVTSIQKTE